MRKFSVIIKCYYLKIDECLENPFLYIPNLSNQKQKSERKKAAAATRLIFVNKNFTHCLCLSGRLALYN